MLFYVTEFFMWLSIIQDMREPQIFPCAVFGLCICGVGGCANIASVIAASIKMVA